MVGIDEGEMRVTVCHSAELLTCAEGPGVTGVTKQRQSGSAAPLRSRRSQNTEGEHSSMNQRDQHSIGATSVQH